MMVEAPTIQRSHYEEYERLLKALHCLIAEGQGDGDEAEAIRDRMDEPWWSLTEAERKRLEGLSTDLDMLSDDEIWEADEGIEVDAWAADLRAARDSRDWESVLAMLRKSPAGSLPQAPRAYLRALAYAALGHEETSLLFARHALALEPDNVWYRLLVIQQLTRLDRRDDALAEMATQADLSHAPVPRAD